MTSGMTQEMIKPICSILLIDANQEPKIITDETLKIFIPIQGIRNN
jgi:hypothetical protein